MKPPSFNGGSLPPDILEQAITWAVRLRSGSAGGTERAACAAWRSANPLHDRAWREMEAVDAAFTQLPALPDGVAYRTLQGSSADLVAKPERRRALKLLGVAAAAGAAALLAQRMLWQQTDRYATSVGERRRILLADGTHLHLNTASRVEIVFTPLRRLIVLAEGEISIDTGKDADSMTGRRPFWVETAHARLEALGTRFIVRQLPVETRLHVTEGAVAIHSAAAPVTVAGTGESFAINTAAVLMRISDADSDPSGWTDGVLVAKQMRLDNLIAELSRYRTAPLACDPNAAALRVSGVFQLDGPDPAERTLDALARTLPIRIVRGPGDAVKVVRN